MRWGFYRITAHKNTSKLVSVQRVGCDLKIGSSERVDACGVCGGNNSTCSDNTFGWEETPLSHCSAPCGGGFMMARLVTDRGQFLLHTYVHELAPGVKFCPKR
jgi:hypothetical protein